MVSEDKIVECKSDRFHCNLVPLLVRSLLHAQLSVSQLSGLLWLSVEQSTDYIYCSSEEKRDCREVSEEMVTTYTVQSL
jgi:hypothetical protein